MLKHFILEISEKETHLQLVEQTLVEKDETIPKHTTYPLSSTMGEIDQYDEGFTTPLMTMTLIKSEDVPQNSKFTHRY